MGLQHAGLAMHWVVWVTLALGLSARLLALRFGLGLPVFHYEQMGH